MLSLWEVYWRIVGRVWKCFQERNDHGGHPEMFWPAQHQTGILSIVEENKKELEGEAQEITKEGCWACFRYDFEDKAKKLNQTIWVGLAHWAGSTHDFE